MAIFLAVALIGACDGYGSGPETGTGPITGRYTGQVGPLGETVGITLQLTDYLGDITGTFAFDSGESGSITGSWSGSTLVFTFHQTQPCTGSFEGIALIEDAGARLAGSYAGTSPCQGEVGERFVVSRP
jgi:hypothetical protein